MKDFIFSYKNEVKPIFQSEVSECGYACLAMTSNYLGNKVSLEHLKKIAKSSVRGSSISELIELAMRVGLKARALKAEIPYLKVATKPLIIHWNLSHFVVCESYNKGFFKIVDPATGVNYINEEELSKCYSGIAIELNVESEYHEEATNEEFNIFSPLKKWTGLKKFYISAFLICFIEQLLSLTSPFAIKIITDEVIPKGDIKLLIFIVIISLALIFLSYFVSYFRSIYLLRFGAAYSYHFSTDILAHLFKLPLDYFSKRDSVSITDKVASISNLREVTSENLILAFVDAIGSILILLFLFFLSPLLASICFISCFCYFLLKTKSINKIKYLSYKSLENWAAWRSFCDESIKSMIQFRISNRSTLRRVKVENKLSSAIQASSKADLNRQKVEHLGNFIFQAEYLLLVGIGSFFVSNNTVTLGTFFAFLALRGILGLKYKSFVDNSYRLSESSVHISRLRDIVVNKCTDPNDGPPDLDVENLLDMQKVSFSYSNEEVPIFSDLDLQIKKGEFVGITGPSGQGKSTLLKLIVGLEQCDSGTIELFGKQVSQLHENNYAGQVFSILQSDKLVSGTIAANISMFDPSPNQNRIIEAARLACIADDINEFPMRYLTLTGYEGNTLSGGQQQRILLARAFYLNPAFLILDEATSSLDFDTELQVIKNLSRIGVSILMITHREKTLEYAHRALNFSGGSLETMSVKKVVRDQKKMIIEQVSIKNLTCIINQNIETLVIFGMENCIPCEGLINSLEHFSSKLNNTKVILVKVDKDYDHHNPYIFKDITIKMFPTALLLNDGEVLGKIQGFPEGSKRQQYAWVKRLFIKSKQLENA